MGGIESIFPGSKPQVHFPKESDNSEMADPSQLLMLDIFSGPNMPLAKAFEWCGWCTVSFDRKIQCPSVKARNLDLSQPDGQAELEKLSRIAAFLAVAFD